MMKPSSGNRHDFIAQRHIVQSDARVPKGDIMTVNTPPDAGAGRCTRTGAQRRREKRRARAVRSGETAGGLKGESATVVLSTAWGDTFTRGDLVDLRKAIRGNWDVPEEKRLAFLALLWRTFQVSENWPRLSIAIAWTVIAMEDANIRAEREQRR